MRRARTYPWIRIRPYRVLLRGQGVLFAAQSWADCITNMSGCDLRQAQPSGIKTQSFWLTWLGNPAPGSVAIRNVEFFFPRYTSNFISSPSAPALQGLALSG